METTTRNGRKETVHVTYPDNLARHTAEDSEIYAVNMIDALLKAREMVMFVSGSVIVAVTTTHNVWEISIHKSKDEDHPFYYYAEDMELQRVYRLIPERDGSKPQRWTIDPT